MKTPLVLAEQALPATSTDRVRAFRKRNRRFDYVPGLDALAAIERLRAANPHLTTAQLIDALVEAGQRMFSEDDRRRRIRVPEP